MIRPPCTLIDVFRGLPEGTLAQLIENKIIISPTPSDKHQKILGDIYLRLGDFIERNHLGETRVAPYDVYLDDDNVFQPDIIFIDKTNTPLIKSEGLHGAPDLVIEILSPGSTRFDKGEKKAVYERSGVKEYWLVDAETKNAEGFILKAGKFSIIGKSKGSIRFASLELVIEF